MMPELTFFNRLSGVHSITTVRPPRLMGIGRQSGIPLQGLPDEEFTRGWANVQSNNYWSSTSNANNTNNAWIVNMWNGNMNNNSKTNNNYVWPVRSGEWLTFETLYRNYLKCRRNKRGTINALKFEMKAEEKLFLLLEQLLNKSYQPSRSVCFIVERPKMREIIAADFSDRVVHHLIVERLETIYEPVFIHDSYACRKGKGLHKAVKRVKEFIRKGSKNGRTKLYFTHMDIRNFFMTIDKEILYGALPRKGGGMGGGMQVIRYDYELLEQLRSVLASYRGHMKWADTYSLRQALLKRYSFLKEYFSFDGGRIRPLYKYCEIFPSVKSQYLYYSCVFRGSFIFFQVGCFYEFYEGSTPFMKDKITLLNLKKVAHSKRGVLYGFPIKLAGQYVKVLVEKRVSVVIIKETDRYIGKVKERLPVIKIVKVKG